MAGTQAEIVQCIAELVGFPQGCGGFLVRGGEEANLACIRAAHAARAADAANAAANTELAVYASAGTHSWIRKAATVVGVGAGSVRWIAADRNRRMLPAALVRQILSDRKRGIHPLIVIGTASVVGTGSVDPLPEIADICREFAIWFHVDGACGTLQAQVPGAPDALRGMSDADSIAVAPHRWLCSPPDAGCVLVRNPASLTALESSASGLP